MGFLSAFDGEEILDLSDLSGDPLGTWTVSISKSVTNKSLYSAKQHIARMVNGKAAPDMAAYHVELVTAAVTDWNLTDRNDRPLALFPPDQKREAIANLPERVFQKILSKVQELNTERSEEEERTFQGEGDGSTDEREGRTTDTWTVPSSQ